MLKLFMRLPIILLFACCWVNGFAQVRNGETFQKDYQIVISKTQTPVKIDGILDDEVWKKAQKVSSFWEKYPDDKKKAKHATEAQTAYDDKFLYVAYTAYDSGKVFIQSLKRDIGHNGIIS